MLERTLPDALAAASPELQRRYAALVQRLHACRRLLVAYSGGVDSTLLLYASVLHLGRERVLGVLADSPSLPRREKEEAVALASRLGAVLRVLPAHELEDPRYASNPMNRCYFCKSELYDLLGAMAAAEGFDAIADGTNSDDAQEVRPGRAAGRERGVRSPLMEAGLSKDDVRALSRLLGLPTWDKPATPCLASRIPFGQAVDVRKLGQVEAAEEALRDCGIRGGRVRHHGDIARVELPEEWMARVAEPELRQRLVRGVRRAGFVYVVVDLEPYRRGRLGEAVAPAAVEVDAARRGEEAAVQRPLLARARDGSKDACDP